MDTPILDQLNPSQYQAVTFQTGPLMVLAGAGSGKTRVLTRRLAYLIHSGAARPEDLLAVTFTNKAAREMRERVLDLLQLPAESGRRLWIGTFHGMSARILRHHGNHLGYEPDFIILDSADQISLIKKLIEKLDYSHPYWNQKRLAHAFSRWKDDGLGPDDIGEAHIHYAKDRQPVVEFFKHYQAELKRVNAMDFGDLLFNCLTLWRQHPEILADYQRRFHHVLVDEYQDTNKVQYEWMKLVSAGQGNLCVVGDDDQAIYSWRGARLDNILRFEEDFPDVQVVRLEKNYRSTGNILKVADRLIKHNGNRMGKNLVTDGEAGPKVALYTAEDGRDEARFVASEATRLVSDNRYEQVAVLVRAAHQTRVLEEAMNNQLIPYHVVGGLRFMDRAEIKDAVAYLRLVYSSRDDLAFERVLNVPKRKLGPMVLNKIQEAADEIEGSLLDGARRLIGQKGLGPAALTKLAAFVAAIDDGRALAREHPAERVLDRLLESSGYLDALHGVEREDEKKANLGELRGFLVQTEDLQSFLEQAALESDPPGRNEQNKEGRLVISTLHAAKGLEFPIVFLVGLEEGLLPHKLAMDDGPAGLEEERRLAYVGMTRAKQRLYLCNARRRLFFNRMEPAMPSRFLKEIPQAEVEKLGMRLTARRFGGGSRGGYGRNFRGRY